MLNPLLQKGIDEATFSAAAAVVVAEVGGDLRLEASLGQIAQTSLSNHAPPPLFDLASLTKPFLASVFLRLSARGSLDLRQPLMDFYPELVSEKLGTSTIEQLLAHEAGLDPWLPLFEAVPRELRATAYGYQGILERIFETQSDKEVSAEAVYSDLGYILLGELLSRHLSKPLQQIVAEEVCVPLRLNSCGFRPVATAPKAPGLIAPTTIRSFREGTLVGEVHDDNAWTMGGVAGHAGLFGTAGDVADFGLAWLHAYRGDARWLSTRLVRSVVAKRPSGRALAWDLKSAEGSSAGTLMSEATFGHLGFTGCSLWIDPLKHVVIVLLTNRVHLEQDNGGIKAFRPWFHDAVMSGLERAT